MERARYRLADAVRALLGAQQAVVHPAAEAALEEAERELDQLLLAIDTQRYRPSYDDAVAALELAAAGARLGWQSYDLAPLIEIGLKRLRTMGT